MRGAARNHAKPFECLARAGAHVYSGRTPASRTGQVVPELLPAKERTERGERVEAQHVLHVLVARDGPEALARGVEGRLEDAERIDAAREHLHGGEGEARAVEAEREPDRRRDGK